MSNITLSFEKDGSVRVTLNVPWGRKRYAKWDSQNFGVPGSVFGSSSRGSFYYIILLVGVKEIYINRKIDRKED